MSEPTFGGWRSCDACGEAIERLDECVLTVSPTSSPGDGRRWRSRRARAAGEEPSADAGLVPCDWGHRSCIPPRDEDYVVDGSRIATLTARHAHLARPAREALVP